MRQAPSLRDLRSARCAERRTPGAGGDPEKRAGRKASTALRVDLTFICPAERGEIGGISLDPMAYPEPKGRPGDNSMPENQRPCPGVRGGALGDLHDKAKAALPEA